jgi:hypothetical protein
LRAEKAYQSELFIAQTDLEALVQKDLLAKSRPMISDLA